MFNFISLALNYINNVTKTSWNFYFHWRSVCQLAVTKGEVSANVGISLNPSRAELAGNRGTSVNDLCTGARVKLAVPWQLSKASSYV